MIPFLMVWNNGGINTTTLNFFWHSLVFHSLYIRLEKKNRFVDRRDLAILLIMRIFSFVDNPSVIEVAGEGMLRAPLIVAQCRRYLDDAQLQIVNPLPP